MGPELLTQPRLGHSCLPRHPSPLPDTHTLFTHPYNTHTHTLTTPSPRRHKKVSLIDLEMERGFLPTLVRFSITFVSCGSRPPRPARRGGLSC